MTGTKHPNGLGGSAYRGVKGYKTPRDVQVKNRGVVCPECQAPVGQPCMTQVGKVLSHFHKCRRRMALRAGLVNRPTPPPADAPVCNGCGRVGVTITTRGVVHWHRHNGGTCPGTGREPR